MKHISCAPAHADGLGQEHREAPARHDADPRVGVGEPGPFGGDEEVAVQRELEAAGDGDAVDRADDRLVHQPGTDRAGRAACAAVGAPRRGGSARRAELLQVEARAERGVGAGEDDHVDVVAPVGLVQRDGSRRSTSEDSALRASGRLSVTVAMRSLTVEQHRARSPLHLFLVGGQELELQVAEAHERRRDPAAHGAEVVVEDRAVRERLLVSSYVPSYDTSIAYPGLRAARGRASRRSGRSARAARTMPIGGLCDGSAARTGSASGARPAAGSEVGSRSRCAADRRSARHVARGDRRSAPTSASRA